LFFIFSFLFLGSAGLPVKPLKHKELPRADFLLTNYFPGKLLGLGCFALLDGLEADNIIWVPKCR